MCAISEAKLKGEDVFFYMLKGSYGGAMSVGSNLAYSVGDTPKGNRIDLITELSKYSSKELATLFADLIENAEED